MTKINDLWLYDQAEQEVAKIDSLPEIPPPIGQGSISSTAF